MNSSILHLYKNVIRMTFWPFLAVWAAAVSLQSCSFQRSISLFIRLCMSACLSSWWHHTGRKEEENCWQAQGWNRGLLSEVELCVWRGRPEFILINCRLRSPDSDKLDGDASAGRSLLLWNCLTDGLHPFTVFYVARKKYPPLLLIREVWVSEQQVNHVGLVGGDTLCVVWEMAVHPVVCNA